MITRLVCCLFLQFIFSSRTVAIVSTACYGPPGLSCTDHRLICTEPLVISITNITFGYRQGCLGNCGNLTCCREGAGDCFTPYNNTLLSQLQQVCNGRSTCTLNSNHGLNESSAHCHFTSAAIRQSYSKIEYHCTENTSSTTLHPTTETSPTTIVSTKTVSNTITSNQASTYLLTQGLATETERETDTDVGAIVGGIVGVIIVIGIVAVVVFFIKRRLKKLKSQNENQYDSTPSGIIDQPTTVDDSLNIRQQTDERTQYIDENHLPATTNGQTQDNYVTQDYEHAYDSAPSVVTDEPKAVYDSLNTREQTGYYNMGNITDDIQLSSTNNGLSPINTNNQDYEHAYTALEHNTNKPKTVYHSLNTREQTGYYNMGSINTTDARKQPDRVNEMTRNQK